MNSTVKKVFLSLLTICVSAISNSQVSTLYVGGYTTGSSKGEGIYTFDFNSETGALKNKKLVARVNNPSYLAISRNKKTVYSVSESSNYLSSNSGAIASFNVLKNGDLEKNAEISSFGGNPCHLSLNEKEDKLVVSNYSGGTFSVYSLYENGSIDSVIQVTQLSHDSIKAHTHYAQFFKDQLFVADLGINTLERFIYNDSLYVRKQSVEMKENSGPRHFAISKNADFIYVINEHASTISTLKKHDSNYKKTSDISTLRKDFKGKNSCADIHLSSNEKYLYASNRGENTIAVFERNKKDGSLKKVQTLSCHGNWPRNFTLGPKGNFLLVANKKSSNIAVFLVDKITGTLTYIYDVKSSRPSCLKF